MDELANDIVFRLAGREEWLARLERLRARTPLDDLRRRYAKTFASMAPGIVVVDSDLDMVFANPRSYEIVGHREETISSDYIRQVVSAEDLPRVRDALSHGQ
ncbi:MAG: PAS domain S-box protein, partial [Myxococcales bacterium]